MNENYNKMYQNMYEYMSLNKKELDQLSNKINDPYSEQAEKLLGEIKANNILMQGVEKPKESLNQIHDKFAAVKEYIQSENNSPRAYGAVTQLESFKSKYDSEVKLLQEKEPAVIRDNIARKLNFLVDKEGKNVYEDLKETSLKANGIAIINKGKTYNHYAISLTSEKDQSQHYINLHTDKNMNTIRSDWKQPKTGSDWLCEDMKAQYMENNPDKQLAGQDKPNYEELEFKPVELTQNRSPKI
ncbi:hypothetical protein B795N_14890 [Marinilactibacillus psychrotolerans]|uniref:hypothetical protein n=1 Tax=Marinilactibacillus psychrotolerans TaxID=191770 RepID=UPI001C7DAAF7|nr:hypothetical protein [Marinilactibacillus psychrotolerans]GEQ33607.1 hypothetical protein B795N_14890 [Marinilactibacillus psychrotolerans]